MIRARGPLAAVLLLSGCVQLASMREPFVAPGTALQVAWRRQLTDPQLFGGKDEFIRDGKVLRVSTGIVYGYKPQEFASAASDGGMRSK